MERWIKHYSSKHQILLVGEGNFSFSLCLAKAFGSACNITATSLNTRGEYTDRRLGLEMEYRTERWIKHYSSKHQILLVGEGNFSFSLCLAKAFGSAFNITATSRNTREELERLYGREALDNVEELRALGCTIFHGIDVHTMNQDDNLRLKCYDRIVFNFPHAGFIVGIGEDKAVMIRTHKNLVRGFLGNAKQMIRVSGKIHITHRVGYPYNFWEIEEMAEAADLRLVKRDTFNISDYPGYVNVRGSGDRCKEQFPIGNSFTYMFGK